MVLEGVPIFVLILSSVRPVICAGSKAVIAFPNELAVVVSFAAATRAAPIVLVGTLIAAAIVAPMVPVKALFVEFTRAELMELNLFGAVMGI